jgi:pimeloyl-ACP methyl ester carboxylesterase
LTLLEAPGVWLLKDRGEDEHYRTFRQMSDEYFAEFEKGNVEAIARMVDFYGGSGTFASWSPRVRAYAIETTSVNILDWATAYSFEMLTALLAAIEIPVLVAWGGSTHPAIQRANTLLAECISGASAATISGAAHFMIGTRAPEVAELIAGHVRRTNFR